MEREPVANEKAVADHLRTSDWERKPHPEPYEASPGRIRAEFNLRQRINWLRTELDDAQRLLWQFYHWGQRDVCDAAPRQPLSADTPIELLELSNRTQMVLTQAFGCKKLRDISLLTRRDLEAAPNMGRKSMTEIDGLMKVTGLELKRF